MLIQVGKRYKRRTYETPSGVIKLRSGVETPHSHMFPFTDGSYPYTIDGRRLTDGGLHSLDLVEEWPETDPVAKLGGTCVDGGTCHHHCLTTCFRELCCIPFSTFTGMWGGRHFTRGEQTPVDLPYTRDLTVDW